jgi:hypothetical protein
MTPLRIVLYASDIVAMLGCSHNKPAASSGHKSPISVAEFCEFTTLKYEEVLFALNRGKVPLDVTVIKRDYLRAVQVK